MRNRTVASMILIASYCCAARAEVYEVPLPEVTGHHTFGDEKAFSFDLGFPLAEIRDVRLRLEGSIVAPWMSGPFNPAGPYDANFQIYMLAEPDVGGVFARGPGAGRVTYPEPEPFAAEVPFNGAPWRFLEDGAARGGTFLFARRDMETPYPVGGSGTVTAATLIIDATPVPEATATTFLSLTLYPLFKRRRHRR